jgi:hypothetical protein
MEGLDGFGAAARSKTGRTGRARTTNHDHDIMAHLWRICELQKSASVGDYSALILCGCGARGAQAPCPKALLFNQVPSGDKLRTCGRPYLWLKALLSNVRTCRALTGRVQARINLEDARQRPEGDKKKVSRWSHVPDQDETSFLGEEVVVPALSFSNPPDF